MPPLYFYECPHCQRTKTEFRKVDERHDGPECHDKMKLKIVPVQVMPDIQAFNVPGTKKFITSRKDKREYMKRNNLTEVGNG